MSGLTPGLFLLILVLSLMGFCTKQVYKEINADMDSAALCEKTRKGIPYEEEKLYITTSEGCQIKQISKCDKDCNCYHPIYYTTCPMDLEWTENVGKYNYNNSNIKLK